jgi:nucleoside-diphosphate-sugar epimerase
MSHLLCFGLGFSARVLAERFAAKGWTVTATSRSAEGAEKIRASGYNALVFEGTAPLPTSAWEGITHVVVSAPPGADGDPVLRLHAGDIAARARQFRWIAYLSTTGVYGDHGGALVSEETPLTPNTERGHKRLLAETQWLALWRSHGLPVQIFRLAGIYGPGRNQLVSLLDGTAKRVIKEGQIFSRIHVADIANVLEASIARPNPGGAYNVCDDEASPPQDVVEYGAKLLGLPVPPAIAFEAAELSPMALSFYADSKRVSNARLKRELGVSLSYPSFREGLAAIARDLRS